VFVEAGEKDKHPKTAWHGRRVLDKEGAQESSLSHQEEKIHKEKGEMREPKAGEVWQLGGGG
jgi:hypothetical protein